MSSHRYDPSNYSRISFAQPNGVAGIVLICVFLPLSGIFIVWFVQCKKIIKSQEEAEAMAAKKSQQDREMAARQAAAGAGLPYGGGGMQVAV